MELLPLKSIKDIPTEEDIFPGYTCVCRMRRASGIEALSEGFGKKGRYRECRRMFYPSFYLPIYPFSEFVAVYGNGLCTCWCPGDKGCPGYIDKKGEARSRRGFEGGCADG